MIANREMIETVECADRSSSERDLQMMDIRFAQVSCRAPLATVFQVTGSSSTACWARR